MSHKEPMDHQFMNPSPHVVMFPLPILGDMSPMLKLAELLCLANLKVTFIITTHNHKCLTKNSEIESHFSQYPEFELELVSDGLPEDHPRSGYTWIPDMLQGLGEHAEPFLRDIVLRKGTEHKSHQQVTCLIADSMLSFAFQVAHEVQVPVIEFRAYGACFLWISLCLPKLIQAGDIPFKDNDMDRLVENAPGMSTILRRRDLPSMFQVRDNEIDINLEQLVNIIPVQKAHSIILNTFDDLEGPILSHLRTDYNPRIYSIGPLPAHLKYRLSQAERKDSNLSSSSWEEDQSCISWLDKKPDKSVVYVSFGSLAIPTRDQVMEIWAGLVQSKKYFLWVVRPDMITGTYLDSPTPDQALLEGTKERGLMVGWAPQEEVLTHRAVAGFLTHSGWNSTLESITAGVPMLCWPYIADQQVNSRYVSEVWRIGLDMKDTCDRSIVEKMVRDLMEERRDEIEISMAKMSQRAKKSVTEGGSSYRNLNRLVDDIRLMSICN